jgi:diacylglycerol kinase family enzyme
MEFDAPVPICIDGEIMGAKNVDFTLLPQAVNFVIPNGSQLSYK